MNRRDFWGRYRTAFWSTTWTPGRLYGTTSLTGDDYCSASRQLLTDGGLAGSGERLVSEHGAYCHFRSKTGGGSGLEAANFVGDFTGSLRDLND